VARTAPLLRAAQRRTSPPHAAIATLLRAAPAARHHAFAAARTSPTSWDDITISIASSRGGYQSRHSLRPAVKSALKPGLAAQQRLAPTLAFSIDGFQTVSERGGGVARSPSVPRK